MNNESKKDWKGTIYDFSNPRKVGSGVWFSFHLNSAQARNRAERLYVCKQIRDFCIYFKCGDCQNHCRKYLVAHPPENTVDTEEGLFRWTIDFRNAVQSRLNAPLYDYTIMHGIFYDETYMVCEEDCGNKSETSTPVPDTKGTGYIEFHVPHGRIKEVRQMFGGNAYNRGREVPKAPFKLTPYM